ncbi:MAG: PIN domain-containing protein [Promicromonosporaceae bacterium]|nr:PIN domain-containing protein [Promicromonosporaceae bacterium]
MSTNSPVWCVDSSVLLRVILGDSPAASRWLEARKASGERLVGSRMLEVEVGRVLINRGFAVTDGDRFLSEFNIMDIDDGVIQQALSISERLSGADSIHVATALVFDSPLVSLVTHDSQMASAAQALGLPIVDPVTDDPNRGPVA